MTERLDPLDTDVLAILATAKPMEAPPTGANERVWAAVQARAALVPHGPSHGASSPSDQPSWARWVGRHPVWALAGAMVVGGAMGAFVRGASTSSEPQPYRPSQPIAPSHADAPSSSSAWIETAPPLASSAAPVVTQPRPAAPASPPGQELAAESALLDLARTAIAQGEAEHALAAIDRHAATFPQGMLREEREALAVKALVLAGRGDEARAREVRFRARYPESLFRPALEGALRSLP